MLWQREQLKEYLYCTVCQQFFPARHKHCRLWLALHVHPPRYCGDSYYPRDHPDFVAQCFQAHIKMSDEILEGYFCVLSDLELLACQGGDT